MIDKWWYIMCVGQIALNAMLLPVYIYTFRRVW